MTKNTSKNGLSWLYWQNNVSFYHFTQIRFIPIQILIIQRFSDIELGLPYMHVSGFFLLYSPLSPNPATWIISSYSWVVLFSFFVVGGNQILALPQCFFLRGYKAFILDKVLLRHLKLLPGTELKGLVHQCDCIVSGQSVHASHGSRFHYKAHGNHRSTPFTRKATKWNRSNRRKILAVTTQLEQLRLEIFFQAF